MYYIKFVFGKGKCNTPPTIVAERSWNVAENTVTFKIQFPLKQEPVRKKNANSNVVGGRSQSTSDSGNRFRWR